jgi:hypothetical protein
MKPFTTPCVGAIALAVACSLPAWADSASSAGLSGSASASVGSASDSLGRSSAGSSRQGGHARAEGDYRIVEVAAMAERPGMARLSLQPVAAAGADSGQVAGQAAPAADGAFALVLPQRVVQQAALGPGHVVTARPRPYGLEFAQGEPRQAFFLVLDDDWMRELSPQAVPL